MKNPKTLILIVFVAIAVAGFFYFSDIFKKNNNKVQTVPILKLLNSHSAPQTGQDWIVSFETQGTANLTITPQGQDTVNDLDFVSLICNGAKESSQILPGDIIYYPNWRCDGTAELVHLVNTARKHDLQFQFGNQLAFAYNNPDSVTDTFTDESKIAATSSMVVIGGQVKLVKTNGATCSSGGECGSGYCVDGVCCDSACSGTPCYRCDSYSNAGAGTCGYVSTASDPDSQCAQGSTSSDGCRSDNCSGTSAACGVQSSGDGGCPVCGKCSDADEACEYHTANTYDSSCAQCKGCSGSEIGTCSTNQTTNWGAATYGCGTANEDKRCYSTAGCKDCSDTSGYFYSDGCTCVSFRSAENKVCWRKGTGSQTCTTACGSYGGCVSANWDDNDSCTVCKYWDSGASCGSSASTSAPYYIPSISWDTAYCWYRSVTSPSCSGTVNILENRLCVCQY